MSPNAESVPPQTNKAEIVVRRVVSGSSQQGPPKSETELKGVSPEPGTTSNEGLGSDGEEEGLDISDFEELLGHLKTSSYKPGEFVFRYMLILCFSAEVRNISLKALSAVLPMAG